VDAKRWSKLEPYQTWLSMKITIIINQNCDSSDIFKNHFLKQNKSCFQVIKIVLTPLNVLRNRKDVKELIWIFDVTFKTFQIIFLLENIA